MSDRGKLAQIEERWLEALWAPFTGKRNMKSEADWAENYADLLLRTVDQLGDMAGLMLSVEEPEDGVIEVKPRSGTIRALFVIDERVWEVIKELMNREPE